MHVSLLCPSDEQLAQVTSWCLRLLVSFSKRYSTRFCFCRIWTWACSPLCELQWRKSFVMVLLYFSSPCCTMKEGIHVWAWIPRRGKSWHVCRVSPLSCGRAQGISITNYGRAVQIYQWLLLIHLQDVQCLLREVYPIIVALRLYDQLMADKSGCWCAKRVWVSLVPWECGILTVMSFSLCKSGS